MKRDLEPAKAILRNFLKELEDIKTLRKNISSPFFTVTNQESLETFAPTIATSPKIVDSYLEKDRAYSWLYGTPCYHPLMCNVEANRPTHQLYMQHVQPFFDDWLSLFLDIQNDKNYRIADPLKDESILAYLQRLYSIIIDKNERRQIWWFSLRSFTNFLRKKVRRKIEDLGELDIIFPEEMTIYFDNIIRKVPITLYPIDIWAVADILQNLVKLVLDGRSQESAAQALGLTWVCLASGHCRLMTRFEILNELHPSDLKEKLQSDPFKPNHWLSIRTLFGKIEAPVSKMVHDYLRALPTKNPHYIFDLAPRSLRRALDRATAASSQAQGLGKITFLTLMHRSHEGRGHRFQGYDERLNNYF